ncbi:transposase [Rossellomorea marisflavi]|nr:transposase [Rossellomorea marisflavi]TYO69967.1 transposase [Rossellomorea marisflavi]
MSIARRKYLQSAKKSFKAQFIDRCLPVKPTQLTKEEHSHVASWLEEDWTTRQLYHLLQHVRYVLKSQGTHQSKRRLDDLIKRFGFHECEVTASIMKTIKARYEPMTQTILSPYSNGIMEGTNNKIKLIKRRGFGNRNEHNLFLRIRSETGH